ncbi:MAG: XTP/dITP diphosphatase [Saccharofermentanales bacterium]
MMKFVVATGNRDKVKEIREILAGMDFEILTMGELGIQDNAPETGETFEENALIKARAVHAVTGGYVMADDSGLSVKALGGAPGIYSARFAGEDTGYDVKIQKIRDMLSASGSDDRSASFVCAIAVVRPDGSEFTVRGECDGVIHHKAEGENGFGYDPVFYMPEYNMTTASMPREIKNSISHRGIALRKMAEVLKNQKNAEHN